MQSRINKFWRWRGSSEPPRRQDPHQLRAWTSLHLVIHCIVSVTVVFCGRRCRRERQWWWLPKRL